jgi:hypothetical protein
MIHQSASRTGVKQCVPKEQKSRLNPLLEYSAVWASIVSQHPFEPGTVRTARPARPCLTHFCCSVTKRSQEGLSLVGAIGLRRLSLNVMGVIRRRNQPKQAAGCLSRLLVALEKA